MNFTQIELEKLKHQEMFEYAEIDVDHRVKCLVKRNLQWVWLQEVLAKLPPKKCLFIAMPDGELSCADFVQKVRSMVYVAWSSTRGMKFSIRQSERRDGVYVLKAAELPPGATMEERIAFWSEKLRTNPVPLSGKVKRKAEALYTRELAKNASGGISS